MPGTPGSFKDKHNLYMGFQIITEGGSLKIDDKNVQFVTGPDKLNGSNVETLTNGDKKSVGDLALAFAADGTKYTIDAGAGPVAPAAPKSKISDLTVADDFLENTATADIVLEAAVTGPPATPAKGIPNGKKFKITLIAPASVVATGINKYTITYDDVSTGTTVPKTVELDKTRDQLKAIFDGKTTDADVHSGGKRARRKSSKRKSAKHKRGGRRGRRKSNKHRR